MNPTWQSFLLEQGARIEAGVVADFGSGVDELRAAAESGVVADLSHLAVLQFSGADAEAFLQGQVTCDVKAVQPERVTLGAYCTPKGRMLADFYLARHRDGLRMMLLRELAVPIQKRLKMFVLRSKVEIADVSEQCVLIGTSGPQARREPDAIEVPGARFLHTRNPAEAIALWSSLASELKPVGASCWQWLDIRAGIPFIGASTQDQLVPQMANLELIGGVSFTKGCYTGQEIVARTHYLGKVKRRMFLARVAADEAPKAGDALYSEDLGAQASGLVVNAQPGPSGDYELLAVANVESRDKSVVHLGSLQGAALEFQALPYSLEAAAK